MMDISLIALLWAFAFIEPVTSQARPLPITWSSTKFGPDGPWQAVSIGVGTGKGQSQVSLYPGGSFDSNIFTTDFCNGTSNGCDAAAAGLYNIQDSPTADYMSIRVPAGVVGWQSEQPMNITGSGVYTIDTMKLASQTTAFFVNEAIFSSVVSSNIHMPNGSSYPSLLGNLALGAPNPVQTFQGENNTNITGQLLTGSLKNNGDIPSSSFGLHIGSASLGQAGSLILGGYDQARVVGPVASYDTVGLGGDPQAPLIDVNIGVESGGSPFNTTNIPSLFSSGTNTSISVLLNPLVPYMSLPPATCAAIAQWLPVTFKPSIGLYTWNTNDYRYKTILSSPSYLSFTFQTNQNSNLTIKVPFSLLNLTLQSPIVATPTQYFPCHPWDSPRAVWHLGRAFMQAAYLGINWESNKVFLGQATGPGMKPSSIQTINPTDVTLAAGDISGFKDSWSSTWKELPANVSASGSNTETSKNGGSGGLSQGAQIGIGVGVGLGAALLLALLALFLLTRRRRKQREQAEALAAAAEEQRRRQEEQERQQQQNSPPRVFSKTGWTEKGNAPFSDRPPDHKHPLFGHYSQPPQYRHELPVLPTELDAPRAIHEAPQTPKFYHEAPSTDFAHEIDSTEISHSPRSQRTDDTALVGDYARAKKTLSTTSNSTSSTSSARTSSRGSRGTTVAAPGVSPTYPLHPVSMLLRDGQPVQGDPNSVPSSQAVSPQTPTSSTYPSSVRG